MPEERTIVAARVTPHASARGAGIAARQKAADRNITLLRKLERIRRDGPGGNCLLQRHVARRLGRAGRRLARLGEPLPLSFDHDRAIDRLDHHNRSDRVEIDAEPDATLKRD